MPKKTTKQIRRKILSRHEEGVTIHELKEEFGIKDTRTLLRSLETAGREREQREVRIRIYTDSQQSHLAQIHKLAEQWKDSVKVNFPLGDFDLSVEGDDLFESLKRHFPDFNLWANYKTWKDKAQKYKKLWDELAEKGNHKAKQDTGLRGPVGMSEGLAASFIPSALWYTMDLRDKWTEKTEKNPAELKEEDFPPSSHKLYHKREIQTSCPYALEFIPERIDIAWGTAESVQKCIFAHYKVINAFWGNIQVIELSDLRKSLRYLESQINRRLRLNLLKQSYISPACDFCPVQALITDTI